MQVSEEAAGKLPTVKKRHTAYVREETGALPTNSNQPLSCQPDSSSELALHRLSQPFTALCLRKNPVSTGIIVSSWALRRSRWW